MSLVAKVVIRGDIFEEIGIKNKWKWEWLSKVVKVGETDEHIGTHFHKIVRGTARCLVCSKDVAYGNRSIKNLNLKKKKEKKKGFDDVEIHDCDAKNTLRVPADCVDFNLGKTFLPCPRIPLL